MDRCPVCKGVMYGGKTTCNECQYLPTDPTTINKYLHVDVMGNGRVWHEFERTKIAGLMVATRCLTCDADLWPSWLSLEHRNPDYLTNKSDSRDFLTFCVTEWKDFEDFLRWTLIKGYIKGFIGMLYPLPKLPTAVFMYLKEKEDG